jgi:hypothetical protein
VIAGENIALAKDGGAGHESVSAVAPMRNVLSPSHVSSVNADATTARMDPCFLAEDEKLSQRSRCRRALGLAGR